MVITVAISNLIIICIATYPVEVVMNFISVAVISEFDNYVYDSMRNEYMKKLVEQEEIFENIFVKHHTTSKMCKPEELSNERDEKGEFRPLKVVFSSRTCCNKLLFIVYKFYRAFFVSLYFYFFPFIGVMLSIFLPLFSSTFDEKD